MKREAFTAFRLSEDEKKQICEEIAAFYLDERGEEIGIIGQQQILDFFMENLAPAIYNKALDDARNWYRGQQDNLEADYYMLYKEQ